MYISLVSMIIMMLLTVPFTAIEHKDTQCMLCVVVVQINDTVKIDVFRSIVLRS